MIFDITSEATSMDFLCEFLEIGNEVVKQYIEGITTDIDVDVFLKKVNRSIEDRNIDDLSLSVVHVTTNDDECQTIKEIGLVNLQQALTMKTPLSRYLKRYNIQFDISHNLMCIKDKFYGIKHDSSSYEIETSNVKLNIVARKIYSDFQINGFFYIQDRKGYGGYIHLRPEIIYNLAQLGSNPGSFVDEWIKLIKPYIIKFNAPLEYFTYYSFYNDIEDFKDDYIEKIKLKKWLVKNALLVLWQYYKNGKVPSEIIAYLKPEVSIPINLITDIELIL